MLKSRDTFGNEIQIGDIVIVGSHRLDALTTYIGDFYECKVIDIEPIEQGPYGDILSLEKKSVGRNLEKEVIMNKGGKYSNHDLNATNDKYNIEIFSFGVIKIDKNISSFR